MKQQFSINLDQKQKKEITSMLSRYRVDFDESKNKHISNKWVYYDNTITLYNTDKLLIQGNDIDDVLDYLGLEDNQTEPNSNSYKFNDEYFYEIGSDETGVGDFFGGVVVCAVRITKSQAISIIKEFKINDSKKITDKYISSIYKQLMNAVDEYEIQAFSPKQYNDFIDEYHNSHIIKTYLHNKVLKQIHMDSSVVCVDQFVNDAKYNEYIKTLKLKKDEVVKIDFFEPKAESKYISVAIASIIARGTYLTLMKKMSENVKIDIPLGSWNQKIQEAGISIYKKHGEKFLRNVCKLDFKSVKEIIK